MFNFLLGAALGWAAASVLQRTSRSTGTAAAGGRVDELSSAADHLPADVGSLNAGDGTPSGEPRSAWRSEPARFDTPAGASDDESRMRAQPAEAAPMSWSRSTES